MISELREFEVLFYAESVGMVTSGHATKMAITPFDRQWPQKTPTTTLDRKPLNRSTFYRRDYIGDITPPANFAISIPLPNLMSIGSEVFDPRGSENRGVPLTRLVALTTVLHYSAELL